MAASLTFGRLVAEFAGDDAKFTAANRRVGKGLKDTSAKAAKASKAMGGFKIALGAIGFAGLAATVVKMGSAIFSMSADFEAGMKNVQAKTGATGADFDALEAKALALGSSTKFSATQAAEALTALGAAGFDTEQSLSSIDAVLSLAAAGSIDLGEAAKVTTGVLGGFGLEADEAARAANVLAAVSAATKTNVTLMGESMKFVAPVAKSLGISMEEASAMIGQLAKGSVDGALAGTSLKSVLSALVGPSKKAEEAFAEMGISLLDSNNALRPGTDLMADLNTALADVASPTERAGVLIDIFGTKMQSAAGILIAASPELDTLAASLTGTNAAAEQAAIKAEGLRPAFTELASAGEGLAIAIGGSGSGSLSGGLETMVRAFTKGVQAVSGAIGPVITGFGDFARGVGVAHDELMTLIPPFRWYFEALKALGGIIVTGTIKAFKDLSHQFSILAGWAETVFGFFADKGKKATEDLGAATTTTGTATKDLGAELSAAALPAIKFEAAAAKTHKTLKTLGDKAGDAEIKVYDLATGIGIAKAAMAAEKKVEDDYAKGLKDAAAEVSGLVTELGHLQAIAPEIAPKFTPLSDAVTQAGTALSDVKPPLVAAKQPLIDFGDVFGKVQASFADAALSGDLGKFKDSIVGLGKELGSTLLKEGLDFLVGKLTGIADLSGRLSGIFGGGLSIPGVPTGTTPSVPQAPGPPSAGGGGGGGGFGGPLDLIFGGISAGSGIYSNIQQNAMLTKLHVIEGNTRFSMQYLGSRGDGGIVTQTLKTVEQLGYANASLDDMKANLAAIAGANAQQEFGWMNASLDTMKQTLWDILAALRSGSRPSAPQEDGESAVEQHISGRGRPSRQRPSPNPVRTPARRARERQQAERVMANIEASGVLVLV